MIEHHQVIQPNPERPQFPSKVYFGVPRDPMGEVTANGQSLRSMHPQYRDIPGHTWGYAGGGPENLSYSLMYDYFDGHVLRFDTRYDPGIKTPWERFYGQFNNDIIQQISPNEQWQLPGSGIKSWLDAQETEERYDWKGWTDYIVQRAEQRIEGFNQLLDAIAHITTAPQVETTTNDLNNEITQLHIVTSTHDLDWARHVGILERKLLDLAGY